jgi:membrane-bound inhibitor of C-type lysozyme
MTPVHLATLSAALCMGCSTPMHQGEPTGERRVRYACANAEEVEMRFFPLQGVGVLVRNGKTMELQQQPAASGFHYTNGPNTVRGKGDELMIEIGRMAPIKCQAR